MDARVESLTRNLKAHDGELYARRASNGVIHVYRRGVRWESYDFGGALLHYSRPSPRFILALTENWTLKTPGVDWGIEPVLSKLKEWDPHLDDTRGEQDRMERERAEQDRKRERRNNNRAIAADMRKDFAKVFNDINTASMDKKLKPRRTKHGYL